MLNSECLRSSRNPLWVAAYCFKQLKKAQVFESDICSYVDKILQEEIDVVSYRVLAFLLLGVVRIYSKKVEYLFHDCNEVLIRINKFVMHTKDNACVETLRMSVMVPDRFELDAFDLDILEDADDFRGHIASQEEITLKDVLGKSEGFGQFSLDKFEEFDFCQNTYSANHVMVEDVPQLNLMDMEFEVFPPTSPINLLAYKDIFRNNIFSQKEPNNFDTVVVGEGVEKESVNLFSQDKQINEDQTVHQTLPYEDQIHEKSRVSQEESVDISMISGREKEPVLSVEACTEFHQVEEEQIMTREISSSLCQMHQEIREVHEARNFQGSKERPQDDESYREECIDRGESPVAKETLEELIEGSVEEHHSKGKLEFQEKVSLEDGMLSVIPPVSKNVDATPQSKFRGGSIGKPKPGAITPEFILISTPAVRDHACFSRKRKTIFDGMVVLPNEILPRGRRLGFLRSRAGYIAYMELEIVPHKRYPLLVIRLVSTLLSLRLLKKSIQDASDLISNRRKFRPTLLTAQTQSCISSLPNGFYESLLPCCSLELQLLFSKKKVKIPDSLEIVETPGKTDVPESQTVDSPEHIEAAPQTPPQCPTIKHRSIEHPERTETQNSGNLGPLSPHGSIEIEQSLKRDEELNLIQELISYKSLEREQCMTKDDNLVLINEDINSCDAENSESCENSCTSSVAGWSERTRRVAMYLHRRFQDQREEEVVNFSQFLGGRVRKECARLFYEILVLRTTSYVDVEQKNAHADIAIRKLPKLDQTFATDSL